MHACNEGQYPYPDENVFLVSGIQVGADQYDPTNTVSRVVIGRRPEVARAYFTNVSSGDWEVNGCVSLAQLKELESKMKAAMSTATTVDVSKGKPADGYGLRQPWLIGKDMFVIASASEDVFSYVKAKGLHPGGVMSEEVLKASIKPLLAAKIGATDDHAYATDYDGGELAEQAAAIGAAMSPEDLAEEAAFMALVSKKRTMGASK